MNILQNAAIATSAVLTIAKGAEAHPGHGTGGGGYALSHYLTDPLHIGIEAAALVAALISVLLWFRRRSAARRSSSRVPL